MELKALETIIKIKKGKKVKKCDYNEDAVRYIQIEDLRHDGEMKYTCDPKSVLANNRDVLIAWDGANAGTVNFNITGAIGSTLSKISIKDKYQEVITSNYLGTFLQSKEEYLRKTATGATIPHINKKALLDLKIPIISIKEQERIIELRSELKNLIAKRQEQIEALDDLVESVFYDLIFENTNEKVKLGNLLSEFIAGKSLAGTRPSEYRVLKTSCVYSGYFDEDEWKFLPEDYKPKDEHIIKNGDLLVSRMNTEELVGASAYVTKDYEDLTIPDRLWILRTNEQVSPIFLWKFFQTQYYSSLINKIATGTSGSMKNISKKNFSELKIPLPPIALQNRFADIVRSIEGEKEKLKASLEELETLFDALMQEAFSGNLV